MGRSHVLVPLDGSPLADDALQYALDTFDCRITVLNVVTPLDAAMSEGGVLEAGEERTDAAHRRSERVIDRAVQQAADRNRTVEPAVESGQPAEVILEYTENHDVDQVVMGGHGGERSRMARRLLGTVSTAVVGEAAVSVTVIR